LISLFHVYLNLYVFFCSVMASKSAKDSALNAVLPKQGLLHFEDTSSLVLCKPKLMPMKTVTLKKLETMQREVELRAKEEQAAAEHLN